MIEETEIQKLKEQYPEFFAQFSDEFWNFLFSEETQSKIAQICLEQGIEEEEKVEKIAYRITLALLNQVPKENLAEILEKGVNLPREVAEKIAVEINRQIFSKTPGILKKKEVPQPVPSPPPTVPEETPTPEIPPEEKPKEVKKDIYREPIE